MNTFAKLRAWWKQRWCEHYWRPALTSRGPAKYCDYCDTTIDLSEPDFYALFGRPSIL